MHTHPVLLPHVHMEMHPTTTPHSGFVIMFSQSHPQKWEWDGLGSICPWETGRWIDCLLHLLVAHKPQTTNQEIHDHDGIVMIMKIMIMGSSKNDAAFPQAHFPPNWLCFERVCCGGYGSPPVFITQQKYQSRQKGDAKTLYTKVDQVEPTKVANHVENRIIKR